MFFNTNRMALLLGAAVQLLMLMPDTGTAHAQALDSQRPQWKQDARDRQRDEWARRERERERARERQRRDDAKSKAVVVGVVGTAVVAGVIAAAAKREREQRERADYCTHRYGNYDRNTDSYRAANGYTYPCR